MHNIPELIERLGGAATVAKRRNKPYTTVASWKERNTIPVREWPGVVDLARERGMHSFSYETLVILHTIQRVAS